MIDSGLRWVPDIARAMASGAAFTFMVSSFMYGFGALDKKGGDHSNYLIKKRVAASHGTVLLLNHQWFPKSLSLRLVNEGFCSWIFT